MSQDFFARSAKGSCYVSAPEQQPLSQIVAGTPRPSTHTNSPILANGVSYVLNSLISKVRQIVHLSRMRLNLRKHLVLSCTRKFPRAVVSNVPAMKVLRSSSFHVVPHLLRCATRTLGRGTLNPSPIVGSASSFDGGTSITCSTTDDPHCPTRCDRSTNEQSEAERPEAKHRT